ncbi:TetR/AcrR family transcriptional regulator C-terminal ligand-binding domain-containing protein [Aureimonas flava]|uniref:TetR/AcrR family transcriptional regulator C-terminal ligand-binding domain-containing protein n=1 Tax=Aureimonas flava TaxID=2320271 RepID=UPI003CCAC398
MPRSVESPLWRRPSVRSSRHARARARDITDRANARGESNAPVDVGTIADGLAAPLYWRLAVIRGGRTASTSDGWPGCERQPLRRIGTRQSPSP